MTISVINEIMLNTSFISFAAATVAKAANRNISAACGRFCKVYAMGRMCAYSGVFGRARSCSVCVHLQTLEVTYHQYNASSQMVLILSSGARFCMAMGRYGLGCVVGMATHVVVVYTLE